MNYTVAECDEAGCTEKATCCIKLGIGFADYCDAHAATHEEERLRYHAENARKARRGVR